MPPFDEAALRQHRDWISRMVEGDTDALRELHRAHVSLLHGIARRILVDPEDVREVVQDVFIKAWQQAGVYRPERGEVYAWLVFITRNQAIDRLRRSTRRHALLTALETDGRFESEDLPHATAERRDLVHRHLGDLTVAQRRALELAFFTGCTQVEIASAMQTPVGNVKNHLRRGLLKLRQLVARHD